MATSDVNMPNTAALGKYFACGQYHDDVVNKFLLEIYNKSYGRCVSAQDLLNAANQYTGVMSQFTVNPRLNSKYNFPLGTYTLEIDSAMIPFHNKKRFIQLYGNFKKPVNLLDIASDGKTFSKRIVCNIGDNLFLHMKFLQSHERHTLLIIYPTAGDGITPAVMKHLIEEHTPFFITYESQSTIYHTSGMLVNLIGATGDEIHFKKTDSAIATFGSEPEDYNCWDVCITNRESTTGRTLLAQYDAGSLKSTTGDEFRFNVAPEFLSSLSSSNSVVDVYLIHQPKRRKIIVYTAGADTAPVMQLEYAKNPADLSSIALYQFDLNTRKRGQRISALEGKILYPDVYDFTVPASMTDSAPLLIEVSETDWKMAGRTSFDNPIQDIQDTLKMVGENYATLITSPDFQTEAPALARYTPSRMKLDWDDYESSKYFGDVRGYKLQKVQELLRDNPMNEVKLTKLLDSINAVSLTKGGTAKEMNLLGRNVMDNSEIAMSKKDDTTHFVEPHTYIKFTSKNDRPPVLTYVNGRYIMPTLVYSYVDSTYVYLPRSKTVELPDGGNSEVVIDAFPKLSTNANTKPFETITFETTGVGVTLFEDKESTDSFCLDDLIFYNAITGEILSKDNFSFSLVVDMYRVTNDFVDEVVLLDKDASIEYFLTANGELFRTKDQVPIILKKPDTEVSVDEFLTANDLTLEDIGSKQFNKTDFKISLKNPALIGSSIAVTTGNQFRTIKRTGKEVKDAGFTIVMDNFCEVASESRFEIYRNGAILSSYEYMIYPLLKMGGPLTIELNHDVFNIANVEDDDTFYVVYTPIDMITLENDRNGIRFTMTKIGPEIALMDSIGRDDIKPSWESFNYIIRVLWEASGHDDISTKPPIINFDNARVYVDGLRQVISSKNSPWQLINTFGCNCIIDDVGPLDLRRRDIIIKIPKRDKDIYNMTGESLEDKILGRHNQWTPPKTSKAPLSAILTDNNSTLTIELQERATFGDLIKVYDGAADITPIKELKITEFSKTHVFKFDPPLSKNVYVTYTDVEYVSDESNRIETSGWAPIPVPSTPPMNVTITENKTVHFGVDGGKGNVGDIFRIYANDVVAGPLATFTVSAIAEDGMYSYTFDKILTGNLWVSYQDKTGNDLESIRVLTTGYETPKDSNAPTNAVIDMREMEVSVTVQAMVGSVINVYASRFAVSPIDTKTITTIADDGIYKIKVTTPVTANIWVSHIDATEYNTESERVESTGYIVMGVSQSPVNPQIQPGNLEIVYGLEESPNATAKVRLYASEDDTLSFYEGDVVSVVDSDMYHIILDTALTSNVFMTFDGNTVAHLESPKVATTGYVEIVPPEPEPNPDPEPSV